MEAIRGACGAGSVWNQRAHRQSVVGLAFTDDTPTDEYRLAMSELLVNTRSGPPASRQRRRPWCPTTSSRVYEHSLSDIQGAGGRQLREVRRGAQRPGRRSRALDLVERRGAGAPTPSGRQQPNSRLDCREAAWRGARRNRGGSMVPRPVREFRDPRESGVVETCFVQLKCSGTCTL
jgi:hypothetical protein